MGLAAAAGGDGDRDGDAGWGRDWMRRISIFLGESVPSSSRRAFSYNSNRLVTAGAPAARRMRFSSSRERVSRATGSRLKRSSLGVAE